MAAVAGPATLVAEGGLRGARHRRGNALLSRGSGCPSEKHRHGCGDGFRGILLARRGNSARLRRHSGVEPDAAGGRGIAESPAMILIPARQPWLAATLVLCPLAGVSLRAQEATNPAPAASTNSPRAMVRPFKPTLNSPVSLFRELLAMSFSEQIRYLTNRTP